MYSLNYKEFLKDKEDPLRFKNKTPNITFYEAIKSNNFAFNPRPQSTHRKPSKRSTSIETTPKESISSLIKTRKEDQEFINQLQVENEFLHESIEAMKDVNRKLVEGKVKSGEIQGMYHDLFVTDLQKQVGNRDEEIENYKTEIKRLQYELDLMKRDKKYMRALLKKYKDTPSASHYNNKRTYSSKDVDSMYSEESTYSKKQANLTSTADKFSLKPPELKLKPSEFDPISTFIDIILKEENFTIVLSALGTCIKNTFKCERASVCLVDEFFKKKYEQFHAAQTIYKSF